MLAWRECQANENQFDKLFRNALCAHSSRSSHHRTAPRHRTHTHTHFYRIWHLNSSHMRPTCVQSVHACNKLHSTPPPHWHTHVRDARSWSRVLGYSNFTIMGHTSSYALASQVSAYTRTSRPHRNQYMQIQKSQPIRILQLIAHECGGLGGSHHLIKRRRARLSRATHELTTVN